MADIRLHCNQCGTDTTVSEYADPESLSCSRCGVRLAFPTTSAKRSAEDLLPENLRRARQEAEARAAQNPTQPVSFREVLARVHKPRLRRSRFLIFRDTIIGSLVFLLLGGLLVYLRFYGGLQRWAPDIPMETFKQIGAGALLFFHVVIVIDALTSDFLTGLFCFLIPGFSLYYLFSESDSFLLRAVVGALLIAFGWDFALIAYQLGQNAFHAINEWLARGGEWR
jgi:hypothetical protein